LVEIARETRQPFKAVLNSVLRRGLGEEPRNGAPFVYEPHPGNLRPGIDERRLNELLWELDQERFTVDDAKRHSGGGGQRR
jgi:hypothetical protein